MQSVKVCERVCLCVSLCVCACVHVCFENNCVQVEESGFLISGFTALECWVFRG